MNAKKTVCAVTLAYITAVFGFSCFAFFLGLDQALKRVKTVSRKDCVSLSRTEQTLTSRKQGRVGKGSTGGLTAGSG